MRQSKNNVQLIGNEMKRAIIGLTLVFSWLPATMAAAQQQCFERVYDAGHLAQHPAQTVRRITAQIQPAVEDSGFKNSVGIGVWFRNDKRQWWAGANCNSSGADFKCIVDGDEAGELRLTQRSGQLRIELTSSLQVEIETSDGDSVPKRVTGAENRVFLLSPTANGHCGVQR